MRAERGQCLLLTQGDGFAIDANIGFPLGQACVKAGWMVNDIGSEDDRVPLDYVSDGVEMLKRNGANVSFTALSWCKPSRSGCKRASRSERAGP